MTAADPYYDRLWRDFWWVVRMAAAFTAGWFFTDLIRWLS